MLTENQIALIKASVPALQEHGVAITTAMYRRMHALNPEMRQLFNQGHQRAGRQQMSLAMAVLAYAQNIENLSVLGDAVKHIASKHVSLNIRPEHYPIVGGHLLEAIKEVLGDAVNDELLDAWAAAYGQLADLLIKVEADLYNSAATAKGGWSGWRGFVITAKTQETSDITSFVLEPADGGELGDVTAGQFVSVRVFLKDDKLIQPRQYTVNAHDGKSMRISVRRIDSVNDNPAGMVSNALHDNYNVGDMVEVSPPLGEFVLEKGQNPVVTITAGVGITPALAMLKSADMSGRALNFFHVCRDDAHMPHRAEIDALIAREPGRKLNVFHTAEKGRPGEADIAAQIVDGATYYVCCPGDMIKFVTDTLVKNGVPQSAVRYERFGTGR